MSNVKVLLISDKNNVLYVKTILYFLSYLTQFFVE